VNVEIGTEAAQFPEKEYINGIFVAVQLLKIKIKSIVFNLFMKNRKFSSR
jgi:hypothetical protein